MPKKWGEYLDDDSDGDTDSGIPEENDLDDSLPIDEDSVPRVRSPRTSGDRKIPARVQLEIMREQRELKKILDDW